MTTKRGVFVPDPARRFNYDQPELPPLLSDPVHLQRQGLHGSQREGADMLDMGHNHSALHVHSSSRVSGIPTATQEMGYLSLKLLPRLVRHSPLSYFLHGPGGPPFGAECPTSPGSATIQPP